jgi:hypothetical protein
MNDNPYSAPRSNVSDVEPAGSLERPRIVVLAVRMLWVSFVLILPESIYEIFNPDPELTLGERIFISLFAAGIVLAITFWLNTAAWNGRGYARWVMIVLTLVGYASLVWLNQTDPAALESPWYIASLDVVSTILGVGGNGMLFAPSANAWYREMKRWR